MTAPLLLDARGIETVTRAVAHAVGLDATGWRLVKFTNNAVVRLPASKAVVRIAGSDAVGRRVPVVLAAAEVYAAAGVPAVRLHPRAPAAVHVLGHVATVWVDGRDERAASPDAAALAAALRRVHAIDGVPPQIPRWDPVASIRRRIAAADGAGEEALAFLAAQCDAVAPLVAALADVPPLLPAGLLHGDAFVGNLVPSRPVPLLCDFDATAVGPREWDLTPVAVGAARMDYADGGGYAAFCAAYGVDVTQWAGFATLRRVRELQLVTSVLPALTANPALRPQWEHRLRTLREGETSVRWAPYPAA